MEIKYKTVSDVLRVGGCTAARVKIRYPVFENSAFPEKLCRECAESYLGFVREKCYGKAEIAFWGYVESGGRRSKYKPEEYLLSLSVTEISEGRVALDILNVVSSGDGQSFRRSFSALFNTEYETLLRLRKGEKAGDK